MAVFYPQFGQVHLAGVRFGAIVPITGAPNHSDCDMIFERWKSSSGSLQCRMTSWFRCLSEVRFWEKYVSGSRPQQIHTPRPSTPFEL